MKKIIKLLTVFVVLIFLFAGCSKPKGTFIIDNYTGYYMSVEWCGYDMSVEPYGYSEYTVNAGGGTAYVYDNYGNSWGSVYIEVPEDDYGGVEIGYKSTKSTEKSLKFTKERNPTPKQQTP